jgi:hypothetical protein
MNKFLIALTAALALSTPATADTGVMVCHMEDKSGHTLKWTWWRFGALLSEVSHQVGDKITRKPPISQPTWHGEADGGYLFIEQDNDSSWRIIVDPKTLRSALYHHADRKAEGMCMAKSNGGDSE